MGTLSALVIGLVSWGVQARAADTTELQTAAQEVAAAEVEQAQDAVDLERQTTRVAAVATNASFALPQSLSCVEQSSSGSTACTDSGGFASRCAVAQCGAGYKLTGGGGSCNAGDRKLKNLSPNFATGEFHVMCEDQGVAPRAKAICCKLITQLQ